MATPSASSTGRTPTRSSPSTASPPADARTAAPLRDLPRGDRPRERLARLGPGALTTPELLAILLGSGTRRGDALQVAAGLLRAAGGLHALAASDAPALAAHHGIGPARAGAIAAAFELGRRAARGADEVRVPITGPLDIARLVGPDLEVLEQEELRVLLLDTRHRVIAERTLYRGSVNAAPGRVAEVFREAVRSNATAIAIAHNHPSGDPSPSRDDVAFTRAVVAAGELLDVSVLDHVVIGRGRHVSMRERALGFDGMQSPRPLR